MLKPRALRSGDRLAIVAPASAFVREELEAGVAEIQRLGFEAVFDEDVFARERYLAGSANLRASAIQRAWDDPSIAGVLCVRGGYGSAQVLPLLDPRQLSTTPKVFVGYSDLTAVLTFLNLQCGIVAFHGPMLAGRFSRGADGYDRRSFESAVCRSVPMGEQQTPGLETICVGEARGPIFGGTITQLLASFRTPFEFNPPQGCLLFLDEVGERPYRLDRMLTQLRQAGVLAKASGIILGELPNCDEPGGGTAGRAVVADVLAGFPGPVVVGYPSGHTEGPALTLPLGVDGRLVAESSPRLIVEESAVS